MSKSYDTFGEALEAMFESRDHDLQVRREPGSTRWVLEKLGSVGADQGPRSYLSESLERAERES